MNMNLRTNLLATAFIAFASCLLPSFTGLRAQNWHPFPGNATFLYSFSQAGSADEWYFAAHADSVRAEGADSAYYLYRIDRQAVPTDLDCNGQAVASTMLMSNKDHYLGRKVLLQSNGVCQFISSAADTFVLQARATAGQAWAWHAGITATVDSVVAGTVLGVADSLKYIHLSNGDTWVLSKGHGIAHCTNLLPFVDDAGTITDVDFEIWGIPELGLGGHLPHFEEVFQFDPSDRFGYRHYQGLHPGSNTDYIEMTILSQSAPTQYQTLQERVRIHAPQAPPADTTYYAAVQQAVTYLPNNYPSLDLLPYEHTPVIPNFFGAAVQAGAHRSASLHDRIQIDFDLKEGYDTCSRGYFDNIAFGHQYFAQGLGETAYDWFNIMTPRSRTLYCYQKGAESWGTCLDLMALSVEPGLAGSVKCFPNPANDRLHLVLDPAAATGAKTATIYALSGHLLAQYHLAEGEMELVIPVHELPAGMYVLRVSGENVGSGEFRVAVVR